jgi:hypothetical protein
MVVLCPARLKLSSARAHLTLNADHWKVKFGLARINTVNGSQPYETASAGSCMHPRTGSWSTVCIENDDCTRSRDQRISDGD